MTMRMAARWQAAALRAALFAATALVALAPQKAAAQLWTGDGGDMNWYNAANWTLGFVPDGSTVVGINGTSSPVIISGGTTASGNIAIGYSSLRGALTITNGGVLSTTGQATVNNSADQGTVTVDNGQWNITGDLYSSYAGIGTLSIFNGGTVSVTGFGMFGAGSGGVSNVTVSGLGSSLTTNSFIVIGGQGAGKVVLTDGGKLTVGGGTGIVRLDMVAGSSGTLIIGADEGQTAAAAGVVEAGSIQFGGGTGKLILNHTSAGFTLGAAMSGSGTVSQLAGVSILSGDSSAFTGTADIDGGTLTVTGKLGGTINVNSGGILGGAGTVKTIVVNTGGTLAPGGVGTIGTLNATGDVTFNSGSTLLLDFGSGGVDRLATTGAVTINPGATLKIDASIAFNPGGQILVSGSSLTGQFGTAILAGGDSIADSVHYDGTSVKLQAAQSGKLVPAAITSSGTAAAGVLDAARGNTQLTNLIAVLDALPAEQKAASLTSLSGQTTTTVAAMPTTAAASVVSTVLNHNTAQPGATAPIRFSGSADSADAGGRSGVATGDQASDADHGAWVSVLGGFGSVDAKNGVAGSSTKTGGLAGGIDLPLKEDQLTAGISFGYVGSRTDIDSDGGAASATAGFLGLYGRLENWGIRLDGTLMGGRHYAEQSRSVTVGTATSTATGENNGWSLGAGLQVSAPFQLVRSDDFNANIRPFAGLTGQRYWQGAFSETGAGTANLSYSAFTHDSLVSRLGAAWEFEAVAGKETRIAPMINLGWAHQFADNAPQMDAAFVLLPDQRFSVTGAQMDRDSLEIGLGVDIVDLGQGLTFTLGYGGSLARDAQDHTFSGRAKLAL
ncbi:MAG TPA: autotransporter domain-containing protein [Ferrovibrio sp.]|uniref:autotransporter outer membrane beta-barrel domain-containing protein n=1 Tax=Ferrovibrio sp. TaxID=1917215 RepID=UPI002ED0348C